MCTCGRWKGGDPAKFNRLSKSLDLALSLQSWPLAGTRKERRDLGVGKGLPSSWCRFAPSLLTGKAGRAGATSDRGTQPWRGAYSSTVSPGLNERRGHSPSAM